MSSYKRVGLPTAIPGGIAEDYYLALQSLEKLGTKKSRIWTHEEIEKGRDLED